MDLRFGLEHDVWHEPRNPGAYEWWYFDAIADDGEYALVAIYCLGLPFSPHYREAVRDHRAGSRARPDPRDFALLSFTLYRRGRWDAYLLNEYPASRCETAADRPLIRIAGSAAEWQAKDCGLRIADRGLATNDERLTTTEPSLLAAATGSPAANPHSAIRNPQSGRFRLRVADTLLGGGEIAGELFFHPRYIPRSEPAGTGEGGAHTWVLAAPSCRVTGELQLRRPRGVKRVRFRGEGYHDHNYGDEDFTAAMRAWSWGRLHVPDATLVYYDVQPLAGGVPTRRLLYLEHSTGAVHALPAEIAGQGWRANPFLLASPGAIRLVGAQDGLSVRACVRPRRIVDPGPFYLRFLSQFQVEVARGDTMERHGGQGFAEYLQPARLDWRWTWPMLKTRFIRSNG